MRSLVVVVDIPRSRNGGAAMRNEQTIRSLSRWGPVDVVVVGAKVREEVDAANESVVSSFEDIRAESGDPGWVRRKSWLLDPQGHWRIERLRSASTLAEVAELGRRTHPDVVVASQWQTVEYARAALQPGSRLVLDTHNVGADHSAVRRRGRFHPKARVVNSRLRAWEGELGDAADQVWVCSEQDASLWRELHGAGTPVVVVPNTVDPGAEPLWVATERDPGVLLYAGSLCYSPNVEAVLELAREVLPAAREPMPGASVQIVGREPVPEVLGLAALDGVDVVGPVDHITPWLARAAAMVVPLRDGGGTRLKILKAMGCGLPVVTTPKGAEGIAARDEEHLLLADTPAGLAAAAVRVARDSKLAEQLSRNGRALVEEHYSPAALDRAVDSALGSMGTGPVAGIACGPNTFMPGVAKAGTTSLVKYLAQHPDVFLPDTKEPNHYVYAPAPPGYDGPRQPDLFDPLLQRSSFPDEVEYRGLYRAAMDSAVRFDASVRYLFHPVAVAAIAHDLPDARHVVVLRDPVERLVSHWRMNRQYQIEPLELGAALAAEDARYDAGIGWDWLYRRLGTYAPQLRHLFSYFPRENVKVVLYGDFVADPEAVLAECFRFLDVDDSFRPDRSERGMVPSEPRWKWLDIQVSWPGPFRRAVRRLPGARGESLLDRLQALNAGPPAPLDNTDLDALRNSFADDMAETAELLGMEVDDLARRLSGKRPRAERS